MTETLTVSTAQGQVAGHMDGNARSWKGVPYAASPVGNRRFAHAEAPQPWAGVKDCTVFGSDCAQVSADGVVGSEDCLFLNIWASNTNSTKKPVMVFLHGGSFCSGTGASKDTNGAILASEGDCIVITVNYRLGVLGVLDFSFLDEDFRANCTVSDVRQALQWIQENIEQFGGDPRNVTLFGQSAGAIMTSLLPVLKGGPDLAARGIMMSGGPTLPVTHEDQISLSHKFLDYMGIAGKDELMSMDVKSLIGRQKQFAREIGLGSGTFLPEIDGDLIKDYPVAAAARGEAHKIPMLIGTTREEMSVLFIPPLAKVFDIDGIMDAGVDAESDEVRSYIAEGYERYGKRKGPMLVSDLVFRIGSTWLAQTLSQLTDVWMYRFDYETPAMRVSKLHAFHSSDIPFVFGNHKEGFAPLMFLFSPSKKGIRRLSEQIRSDFLQFARTGQLDWAKCEGKNTPAKCYNKKITMEPAVPVDLLERYDASDFKRRSFAGVSNNLHGRAV